MRQRVLVERGVALLIRSCCELLGGLVRSIVSFCCLLLVDADDADASPGCELTRKHNTSNYWHATALRHAPCYASPAAIWYLDLDWLHLPWGLVWRKVFEDSVKYWDNFPMYQVFIHYYSEYMHAYLLPGSWCQVRRKLWTRQVGFFILSFCFPSCVVFSHRGRLTITGDHS